MSEFILVKGNNGVDYVHYNDPQPIYTKHIHWLGHGKVGRVEYRGLPATPENIFALQQGHDKKTEKGHWYHALVRHGLPGKCGYYPVPLLFATESERKRIAAERGIAPPNESWVAFKREEILSYYGLQSATLWERLISLFAWVKRPITPIAG